MKIGKINKASRFTTVLLGVAVAGALLFAACQDIFDASTPKSQDDGYGYVVVDLGDEARTVRPPIEGTSGLTKYVYTFTGVDIEVTAEYVSTTSISDAFRLPVGKYKLAVDAYTTANESQVTNISAKGEYADGDGTFQIVSGNPTNIRVKLTPVESVNGNLTVNIKIPVSSPDNAKGVFTLERITATGNTTLGKVDIKTLAGYSITNGLTITNASLPAGTYLFTGRINTETGKYAGFSEAVHIVAYMTTTFTKDYTDVNNPGALAEITSSDEAIAILKDEIKDWITPDPATTNVLASVSGVEKLDDTSTIRLNYIGTEMAKLTGPNVFPLTLQGGWAIADDSWMPVTGAIWSVPNYTGTTTFKLVNKAVNPTKNNNVITGYNTKYTVELRAVAEYQVSYGKNVDSSVRGIEIANVSLGTADDKGVKKGIGVVGSTVITVNNAAITNNGAYAAVTGTPLTHTLNAASTVYQIVIYETAEDQKTSAIARLQEEIAYKGTDTTKKAWIQDTNVLAVGDWVDSSKDASTPGDQTIDTVVYFVADRIKSADNESITIIPPQDDLRWAPVGVVNMTGCKTATNSDGTKVTLTFTPWGGTSSTYDVFLKPVAEFIVDFYPETTNGALRPGDTGYKPEYETDRNPGTDAAGTVSIKDTATGSTAAEFKTTDKAHNKRFILNTTTAMDVTLSKVTIQIDEWDTANSVFDFKNAYKQTPPATPLNSDITQDGVYKLSGAVSRVYTINVYPSIADQQTAAVNQLAAETKSENWTTASTAGGLTNQRIEPITNPTAGSGTTILPSSTIVYVGLSNQEPKFRFPEDGDYPGNATSPYISTNGWISVNQASTGTAGLVAQQGSKDVAIKFKPKGGETADLYNFKLVKAVEYELLFAKRPIGNANTTGTVRVTGNNPGISSQITPIDYTGNTPAKKPLIGIGGAINITSPSTNNILKLTGATGTPTSTVTITPADADTVSSYTITVYPSMADQVKDVSDALKAVDSLTGWAVNITSVLGTIDNANSANKSTFQIIAATMPAALAPPASFLLNSDYTLTHTAGTTSPGDLDATKGYRKDTLKFLSIGGTTGNATQELTYTVELYQVARYNVEFMPGPNKSNEYQGNIQITTYVPTTAANPATGANISISSGPGPKSYIGGIGSSATVAIASSNANVFSTNISPTGTVVASQSIPGLTFNTTTALTSADFTIQVYPTVVDQIAQVRRMMSGVTGPVQNPNASTATGWFNTITGTPPTTTLVEGIVPAGNNISEIKYYGAEPTVKIPTGFFQTGYTFAIVASDDDSSTEGSANSWKNQVINFTPLGGTLGAVYTIRTIPVAKFTVEFTGGARGQITITPPYASSKPKGPIVVSENMTGTALTGYIGIGAGTKIKIESASTNFTDVMIIDPPTNDFTTLKPNATGVDEKTVTTSARAYTVRVSKTN